MRHILTCLAVVFSLMIAGCDNKKSGNDPKPTPGGNHQHTEGDAHDHDHEHNHGPNMGQVFEFDNKDYKGEVVVSQDNNLVRFFLLTSNNGEAKVKVEKFVVTPLAGSDSTPHELEAEKEDADGKTHIFSLDNRDLRIAVPLGVRVDIKADGLELNGTIEPYEPCYH